METDRSSPIDDDIAVRLRWPSAPLADERPDPLEAEPATTDYESRDVASPVVAEIVSAAPDPAWAGRGLIEAYDRLGSRVLERLRALREDVDADLAAVRSELGSLRQAVDDVGDRVQLRQLRVSMDELRGDVSGLRRADLDWPDLEQLSGDVAGLRANLSAQLSSDVAGLRADLSEQLSSDVAGLRAGLSEQLSGDVAGLRADLSEQLSGDVAGLRANLSELLGRQGALDQMSGDVAGLRDGLHELLAGEDRLSRGADAPGELDFIRVELAEVRHLLAGTAGLPALAPLIEEVSLLREEVSSLRRRIALRASGVAVEMSEEQLQRMIVALEASVLGR